MLRNNNSNPKHAISFNTSGTFRYNLNDGTNNIFADTGSDYGDNSLNLFSTTITGQSATGLTHFVNGSQDGQFDTSLMGDTGSTADTISWAAFPFGGVVQEIIFYETDQSAKRRAIEENIGSNYGITVTSSKDGTVSTWYDQSTTAGTPNANHAVQTDAASQPKIVDGGSYVDELRFDGVNDFMVSDVSTSGDDTTILVAKNNSTTGGSLFLDNQAASPKALYVTNSNFQAYYGAASDVNYGSLNNDYNLHFISTNATDSNNRYGSLNGTVDLLNSGTNNYAALSIGISRAGSSHLNGSIKEIIIYNSDQTDNRTAIEANIGEVYSIAGIPAYDDTVNGFVESWYDQSGNGNDATQLTAGSQPKIVDAGSLVTGGLEFDGVNDDLDLPQVITSIDSASSFVVAKSDTTSTTSTSLSLSRNTPNAARFYTTIMVGGSFYFGYGSSTTAVSLGAANTARHLFAGIAGASTAEGFIDGVSGGSIASSSGYSPQSGGIGSVNGSTFWSGQIQEIIIYPSDQSANRVAIETNINNQYDIY